MLRLLGTLGSCTVVFLVGCGTTESPHDSAPGGSGGGGGSAGTSAGGRSSGGAPSGGSSLGGTAGLSQGGGGSAGASGTSAASGGRGGAGAGAAGTAGLASGGAQSNGGAAGTSSGAGGAVSGAGGSAGSEAAGASGAAGMAGSAGGGSTLHGGSSAAFVCTPGATYGDPLTGMGSVVTIPAPTSGSATYFAFLEGPVWIGSLGTLFFSDNASQPAERIWKVVPGVNDVPAVFQEMSLSNGMAVDNDDKLVITDEVGNRITRLDPTASTPTQTQIVAAGCKPNDIIVRSDNNIYYTSPNGNGTGFYRIDPSNKLTGPRTDVSAPNGIELSPDEKTLYVDNVQNKQVTKFTLDDAGAVGATGTLFATTTNDTADGMCVDCAGNLYVGTSGAIEVYSPAGTKLGTVPTGYSSNCTFGGADRKTLYVTSQGMLKSVKLAVPGLPD